MSRSCRQNNDSYDDSIVKFKGTVSPEHAEKVLKPIIQRRASALDVDLRDSETHLKAGSSMNPAGRYNLRSSKTNSFQKIKEENIIAVSRGHNRGVEEGMINALRNMNISANDKRDKGQKPPFVEMKGDVYYYLAEKQPKSSKSIEKSSKK